MKVRSWLASFTVLAACQFGDNQSLHTQPDSGMSKDSAVIHPTDAAIDSPPNACTIVPQSGCSGSTPACDIHDDGSTFCRAVTSQGTSNNHCAVDTECKDGYTCIDDGSAHAAWCARFCTLDSHCTGTGSRCLNELSSNGNPIGATVCTNACDAYAQTGCPSGMGCMPFNDTSGDFTDCAYKGTTAIKLTRDKWRYVCDPHALQMQVSFTVTR